MKLLLKNGSKFQGRLFCFLTGPFNKTPYHSKDFGGLRKNEYGQLGQGTQNYAFYSEMGKIAENVVYVDYSQEEFVIFLTSDHKLYGLDWKFEV